MFLTSLTFRGAERRISRKLEAHVRGENMRGTESINFPSDQNAINAHYLGEVTLTDRFPNNIVHFSFRIADCCKMRWGS